MANRESGGIIYLFLSVWAVMVNWYFNHSIFYAILAFFFNGFYLIYSLLVGHFADGGISKIWNHYF